MDLVTVEIEGQTYAKVTDGKPVYKDGDKEIAFDAAGTVATISRLNGEAKQNRERYEKAETTLKAFEGIDDPKKALDALNTVSNLDHKKLIDAGEVEKVKGEVTKVYEEKLTAEQKRAEEAIAALNKEMIGGSFSRSKFISDKIAVPADIIQSRFGANFNIDGGKIIAKDSSGNQIYSKSSPGEPAGFEEALEILVEQYPYKDSILKGSGGAGSGTSPNKGNGSNGAKTITRAEFDALGPLERSAKAKDHQIVDA
jgi:hypothetical protein